MELKELQERREQQLLEQRNQRWLSYSLPQIYNYQHPGPNTERVLCSWKEKFGAMVVALVEEAAKGYDRRPR
jgi:hypothetical protein